MKFSFNMKDKSAEINLDAEKLIEKKMDMSANIEKPIKKTRYQIKQEEKRKEMELQHKQQMQWIKILLGMIAVCGLFGIVASILGV